MNTKTTITIEAYREQWSGAVVLMAWRTDPDGKSFSGEVKWEEVPAGVMPRPMLKIPREGSEDSAGLQVLADSLFQCGIRPSQTLGTAGEKQAMAAHLSDMRTLAAHALKVQLPNTKTS
jgi:hypothetical protein